LIVTFSSAPDTWRYRLTLPDGTQAEASPRVKDLYSGLSILEISQRELPGLALADDLPDAGSTVYTAAAAGIEKPVVSRGILGAIDRKFTGRELPPLLQCDVRTTETSPGAAVVNDEGKLLGIIAISSLAGQGDGWTYAVPVRHVERVRKEYSKGDLKTIRPQRPVLGLRLAGKGEDSVEVEDVTAGGPADKAGIRKGDQVIAVGGQKVRSVYHVVSMVLNHQPGDRMDFTVQQGKDLKDVKLTLARGEPVGQDQRPSGLVARKFIFGAPEDDGRPPSGPRVPRDPVGLLETQITRLYSLVEMQRQGYERLAREMEKVQAENAALKQQVSDLERAKK
jgi:S1-C subfamily serine protease